MNKSLLIGAALIAAGAGIYFYSQGNISTSEVMEQAADTATKAADDAAASAKAAEEAAAKAAEEAAAKVAEEAAKAEEAAAAEEAAKAAAAEAEDAAINAASSAENAITNALSGAVDAASEPAAEGASNMATESASTEISEDPAPSEQETLLTVDGFDAAKVSEMVDNSNLDPMKKTLLKAAIDKAGENPEMVKVVIEQVKTALGM